MSPAGAPNLLPNTERYNIHTEIDVIYHSPWIILDACTVDYCEQNEKPVPIMVALLHAVEKYRPEHVENISFGIGTFFVTEYVRIDL